MHRTNIVNQKDVFLNIYNSVKLCIYAQDENINTQIFIPNLTQPANCELIELTDVPAIPN